MKIVDIAVKKVYRFNLSLIHIWENRRYVTFFKAAYIDSLSTANVNLLDCFLFRPFPDYNVLPLTEEQSQELQRQLSLIHI